MHPVQDPGSVVGWFLSLWRLQMGIFFRFAGPLRGESTADRWIPLRKPMTQSFGIFFDLQTNGWPNYRDAGDLKRHRAHHDLIVMSSFVWTLKGFLVRVTEVAQWDYLGAFEATLKRQLNDHILSPFVVHLKSRGIPLARKYPWWLRENK